MVPAADSPLHHRPTSACEIPASPWGPVSQPPTAALPAWAGGAGEQSTPVPQDPGALLRSQPPPPPQHSLLSIGSTFLISSLLPRSFALSTTHSCAHETKQKRSELQQTEQAAEMSESQEWLIFFSHFQSISTPHTAPFPQHYQPAQDLNMPSADPGWSHLTGLTGQTRRLPRHL